MELYTMRYIVTIAELGSFSIAAHSCHIGQPALSQQVARLEKELGVILFNRNPHGVSLTEPGQTFVRRAREILQRADALQAEMGRYSGLRAGTLNLGCIVSLQCIDFGGMLSAFCGAYPEISVNINEGGSYDLLQQLDDRAADVVFLNLPSSGLPKGIEGIKLGEDLFSLAVPKLHPLAGRESVSITQLKNEPFVFHRNGQVAAELCYNACRAAGFEPHIVCRSASPTADLYLVRGGLGLAFLPVEEFSSHLMRNVVEVKLREPIRKEVYVAWRKDANSPLIDALVQFARDWVRR